MRSPAAIAPRHRNQGARRSGLRMWPADRASTHARLMDSERGTPPGRLGAGRRVFARAQTSAGRRTLLVPCGGIGRPFERPHCLLGRHEIRRSEAFGHESSSAGTRRVPNRGPPEMAPVVGEPFARPPDGRILQPPIACRADTVHFLNAADPSSRRGSGQASVALARVAADGL